MDPIGSSSDIYEGLSPYNNSTVPGNKSYWDIDTNLQPTKGTVNSVVLYGQHVSSTPLTKSITDSSNFVIIPEVPKPWSLLPIKTTPIK